MSNPEPDGINVEVELLPEHEWRTLQLREAGFTDFAAFRLSVSGCDYHDAIKLLRDGASEAQVLNILL